MGWLITQMWLLIALAAVFGGLIGWVLRGRRMQAALELATAERDAALAQTAETTANGPSASVAEDRLSKLEVALAAERESVADLKSQLASAPPPVAEDEGDDGSLTWRNRYLESRVRYLERKLADADEAAAQPEEEDPELLRMKWRNRYLEARVKYLEEDVGEPAPTVAMAAAAAADVAEAPAPPAPAAEEAEPADASEDADKPPALDAPRAEGKDNLQAVGGIGPKIEGVLNELGVFHFDQIAAWSRKEVEWIDGFLRFKGRIDRERWIDQSAALASGDADGAKAIAKASKKK